MKEKNGVHFYERYVKRMFDILISSLGCIIISPLALICAMAIKLDDPRGDILFRQERNGRDGRVIRIVKFRTMKRELSGGDVVAKGDTLTGVGRVIRKFSLDEIPQLTSILRGDMSLIGPRPLPVRYYASYNQQELRRFEVRPGLTGLSQINGRVNLNWDQRFLMDVEYVKSLSFALDFKIFMRTVPAVFSHKDAMMENEDSAEWFDVYRRKQIEQQDARETKELMGA